MWRMRKGRRKSFRSLRSCFFPQARVELRADCRFLMDHFVILRDRSVFYRAAPRFLSLFPSFSSVPLERRQTRSSLFFPSSSTSLFARDFGTTFAGCARVRRV